MTFWVCWLAGAAPQTGWLKQQKFILDLEADSPRPGCGQSWFLLRSLSLACRWLSSLCIFTSVCVCIQISPSQKVTSHFGNPTDCSLPGSCPWDSPSKNIGVGCHLFLQRTFPQGLSSYLLHWQTDSLPPSHQGSPFWIRVHPNDLILT